MRFSAAMNVPWKPNFNTLPARWMKQWGRGVSYLIICKERHEKIDNNIFKVNTVTRVGLEIGQKSG
jgi:hypothetical protein